MELEKTYEKECRRLADMLCENGIGSCRFESNQDFVTMHCKMYQEEIIDGVYVRLHTKSIKAKSYDELVNFMASFVVDEVNRVRNRLFVAGEKYVSKDADRDGLLIEIISTENKDIEFSYSGKLRQTTSTIVTYKKLNSSDEGQMDTFTVGSIFSISLCRAFILENFRLT